MFGGGAGSCNMASVEHEPSPRWAHCSALAEGQVYVFGGRTKDFTQKKKELSSTLHSFDPCIESWNQPAVATGNKEFPLGLYASACASTGHHVYVYGGWDGTEWQGSLHKLNCKTMKWTKLSTGDNGPMKKSRCGLVIYYDKLVLFGGYGCHSGSIQRGEEFVQSKKFGYPRGWTNELHIFDLKQSKEFNKIKATLASL